MGFADNYRVGNKNIIVARDTDHLYLIIVDEIKRLGNNADLNHIDTSKIKDMSYLFNGSIFNGDISKWNVSNVIDMHGMFSNSLFNGDISEWDVGNVISTERMFSNSAFNRDISNWNVSKLEYSSNMFNGSQFNGDISEWDVRNVKDMDHIFANSLFNGDISKWNINLDKFVKRLATFESIGTSSINKLKTVIDRILFECKIDKSNYPKVILDYMIKNEYNL